MIPIALGLDFGTESVRAVLIDAEGAERGVGTDTFSHGQITEQLPGTGERLPARTALQHPQDWIDSAAKAISKATTSAGLDTNAIVGMGVDFTSCTMLPSLADGTPLCQAESLGNNRFAWPKLWKHHGAIDQTARMNRVAQQRQEAFLRRYGGKIGLEWFFPKMLETIENAPDVADAAEVWLEAGDWFVWKLVGAPASELPRSTCQAGYKAMWSAKDGFPSADYLATVHPELAAAAASKMPGRLYSPGECCGRLCDSMAARLGLPKGIPVSAAIIDAHAAVPGVGEGEPGVLVMVLGTSSCHMLNSVSDAFVPGVAGVVEGGIVPGLFGYETGQAAVGDAFAWLLKLLNLESFDHLGEQSMRLPAGADGVLCMDWMNGCRTPLMDGGLRGAFIGLGLEHGPAHLYRALLEASGFGLRWIVELLRDSGVPVDRFIATGGLPHHNPTIVQVYADVLNTEIEIHPSKHGPAVGAAVLGMVAAGSERSGFGSIQEAATAMATVPADQREIVRPSGASVNVYDDLYDRYRTLADGIVAAQQASP